LSKDSNVLHFYFSEARDRLKQIREEQSRSSREVVDIWEQFLSYFSDKLGNDVWPVYEQVCIAACDCGEISLAHRCVRELNRQFPKSFRVKGLEGMVLEANQRYDTAEHLYKTILQDDPTNSVAEKRLVVIYKSQNKIKEAITELRKYLDSHMADTDSWLELSDLYLSQMDYAHAAFCLEELILANPHYHLFHQRYAEIRYTQGGTENLLEARAYFSQAIKLNPNNIRALYGLFLCASNLATKQRSAESKNMKYAAWAAEQISQLYRKLGGRGTKSSSDSTEQIKALGGMFDKLQLTSS
ncbi:hypothetical protein CAPTEDRAFT_108309, partial [Capitella teleta]